MNYLKKLIEFAFSILFFCIFYTLRFLKIKNIKEHHEFKWVWIGNSICPIDKPLVKHIKRLNKAGYRTLFSCQGETKLENGNIFFHPPYIYAKILPLFLIKKSKKIGFKVKKSNIGICIYFYDNSILPHFQNSDKNLNDMENLLEEWFKNEKNIIKEKEL